ncbi:hypothetical protein DPQ33_01055 [Oceanidesulfovibrio indonesiensis]|uniref:Glycerophosphoryl diester phosphodiesterase membrane domain-containing protein n=1 Tax=Oceanidesulfovibrio indonesiensis TaxID=54767 RepID=A0A7M3MK96_9BACT|nr:hypothetical protein [Oceanidesulfovibrio indonesiensis]TVM19851.1 hypothetical protein DPQ33_01055 [Oceanidesulfovibrio indonesiensis]
MREDAMKIGVQTMFSVSYTIFRENMKLLVSVVVWMSVPYYIWIALGCLQDSGWFISNAVLNGNGHILIDILHVIACAITVVSLMFLPPAVVFSVAGIYSERSIGIRDVLMFCVKRWKILTKTILLAFPIYLVATALLFVFIMSTYDIIWNMNIGWRILAILAASGVLLAGSVWLVLRILLVLQVVVVERVGGFQAFSRSFVIMKDNTKTGLIIFGVYAVMVTLSAFATDIIPFFRVGVVVGEVLAIIATAFLSIAGTVLYFSSRRRHENSDLELPAEEAGP